jgi:hypothetical protein
LYREVAKYSQQVQRYLDIFGQGNVQVVLFDDFARDTAAVYRETLRFLGVRNDFSPDLKILNPNKRVRNRAMRQLLFDPPRVVKWARMIFPEAPRRALRQKFKALTVATEPRPSMDAKLRKTLQAEFAADVDRLSALIDRDLSCWSKS